MELMGEDRYGREFYGVPEFPSGPEPVHLRRKEKGAKGEIVPAAFGFENAEKEKEEWVIPFWGGRELGWEMVRV